MPRRKSMDSIARQGGRLQDRVWNELRRTTDPVRRQTLRNRLDRVNAASSRYLSNVYERVGRNARRSMARGVGRDEAYQRAENRGYSRSSYMGINAG